MSDIDPKRIVGFDQTFLRTLECDICSKILDNPLTTSCGHTFCEQCLQQSIDDGSKECGKCRKAFTIYAKTSNSIVDANSDVLKEYVFTQNLKLCQVINHLKIKCDYDFNGCEESVELYKLSEHLERCVQRFCEDCELLISLREDHNCRQLLKRDRNEWKAKYEKSLEVFEREAKALNEKYEKNMKVFRKERMESEEKFGKRFLRQKIKAQKTEINNLLAKTQQLEKQLANVRKRITAKKMQFPITFIARYIQFGTYKLQPRRIGINKDLIQLTNRTKVSNKRRYVKIRFSEIQELLFCIDSSLSALFIQPSIELYKRWMDSGSDSLNGVNFEIDCEDPKKWYIVFGIAEHNRELFSAVTEISKVCSNVYSIDVKRAKELLN